MYLALPGTRGENTVTCRDSRSLVGNDFQVLLPVRSKTEEPRLLSPACVARDVRPKRHGVPFRMGTWSVNEF